MREGEKGGALNVVFDNCSGQNKNNMVLRLVPYLVEMGYFKRFDKNFVCGVCKKLSRYAFHCAKNYLQEKRFSFNGRII